jgi:hypothetical protein
MTRRSIFQSLLAGFCASSAVAAPTKKSVILDSAWIVGVRPFRIPRPTEVSYEVLHFPWRGEKCEHDAIHIPSHGSPGFEPILWQIEMMKGKK